MQFISLVDFNLLTNLFSNYEREGPDKIKLRVSKGVNNFKLEQMQTNLKGYEITNDLEFEFYY